MSPSEYCKLEILDKLNSNEYLYASLDLSAVSVAWAPGVSDPSVCGGFTGDQLADLIRTITSSGKLKVLDIVEWNPAIEDYRTAHLMTNIIYQVLLGLSDSNLWF
mmetsp:Transcript_4600/g.2597  ORF Transcript_4600/g.2597 Transcript_4600/m.2597 type:complete len:105 (-) Transcript_4600:33-347(-)|eukprot:CAMPEP_0201284278 /NCGR_PEP_ID=MMETSP1317-20130820/68947_1 /ASSEMBLY_ACC=CAM_ASM_000770 /TAXON_ID=187299 /ORGANISM="Undescribed Undescribed, Strain Undescribed" /LENGTH=104 /DNA_ID=CAMNT_0047603795 /DNA_START=267 /DNA_END=581 /DNA_ORIENTATION=-